MILSVNLNNFLMNGYNSVQIIEYCLRKLYTCYLEYLFNLLKIMINLMIF